MITIQQILKGLRASELREHTYGEGAFTDLAKLNTIITLVNQAVEELNKDLLLSRTTYALEYTPAEDRYRVAVCNLEKIIAVYDSCGNDFSLNSGAMLKYEPSTFNTVGDERSPLIASTETYDTLYFPYKHKPQVFNVICRTAFCDIPHAFTIEEGLLSYIPLPKAFLQAILAYVGHKIAKPIAPTREGNLNASNDQIILYDLAVKKLKEQGYANELGFSTDRLFLNSTFK